MTSQVNWALLGAVIERPGYAAALARRLKRIYGDALALNSESHVYTALNELEGRGLIERLPDAPAAFSATDRQPKPVYRATAEGIRAFRERVRTQAGEDRRQLRQFACQLAVFARNGEPEVAIEILQEVEQIYLAESRRVQAGAGIEGSTGKPDTLADARVGGSAGKPVTVADTLIAKERSLVMERRLPWVQFAIAQFRAVDPGAGDEPARP
jgi:DNA-binding PadR family transcriptional regulator